MAYPANIPAEAQITPATSGTLITASANEFTPYRSFHANVSETITVQFTDKETTTDLVVVAGSPYPYAIKKLTVGTGVVGLR